MENKIIFIKKKRVYPKSPTPSIRVQRDTYIRCANIADEIGVSVGDVTEKLVSFALDHVNIVKEEDVCQLKLIN